MIDHLWASSISYRRYLGLNHNTSPHRYMQTCIHKQVERLSKINNIQRLHCSFAKQTFQLFKTLLLQLSPRDFLFLGCQVSTWLRHICKILNVLPEIGKETKYSFDFRFGSGRFHFLNHLQLFRVCKSFS